MDNVLQFLNGNDCFDVQDFLSFLESAGIVEIKDTRLSSLSKALDDWSDDDKEE